MPHMFDNVVCRFLGLYFYIPTLPQNLSTHGSFLNFRIDKFDAYHVKLLLQSNSEV